MSTKTILFSFAAFLLLNVSFCQAAENLAAIPSSGPTTPTGWYDDFDLALKAAQTAQKKLYILFTGSDWCGWCIKLKENVLTKKAFLDYAKDNLVLVEVDFPENKPQMPVQKKANDALMRKYGVEGFPTILLLNGDGRELARLEYKNYTPEEYVEYIKDALKKK